MVPPDFSPLYNHLDTPVTFTVTAMASIRIDLALLTAPELPLTVTGPEKTMGASTWDALYRAAPDWSASLFVKQVAP